MNKLLQNTLDIEKDNKFLKYIVCRVQREDYRGVHVSQHNRYDIDKLEKILKIIYKVAGKNSFSVPSGDIGNKEKKKLKEMRNEHPEFNEIYERLKSSKILDGPNPLKKNLFVDFSRAGFLEKFDKKGHRLDPFRRTHTKTIRLSAEGISLLKANTLFEKYKIFTDGLEQLLRNTLVDLVSAIELSDYRTARFYFDEYTLIFSDHKLNGIEKVEILKAWRSLTRNQQDKALKLIKEYCNPKRFSGNKTNKKDYHNWSNETQQLMSLFKTTIYFQVHDNWFSLNTGKAFGIFTMRRSTEPKNRYFKEHKIAKQENYELHHIVPLSYVKNQEEYKLIDDFRNLIYLHKNKHKKIKRDLIIFTHNDPKVYFRDRHNPNSKPVMAKRGVNADFCSSLLSKIKEYNKKLRKSLLNGS